MLAAIDVGSNTVRMLIGDCAARQVQADHYYRCITRLGGGYTPGMGLAAESIERTLAALAAFSKILHQQSITKVRAVGTAALRRAENSQEFQEGFTELTQLKLEIITGDEEAQLTARGVLSAIHPIPATALILDVGGGSTELILVEDGQILFRRSYPLGVVRLCEEEPDDSARLTAISRMLDELYLDLSRSHMKDKLGGSCQLVGTAGTVTTLAAMAQQMIDYDPHRINNFTLSRGWLQQAYNRLAPMSVEERERLPGMEEGRGDLIVPGLQLVLSLLERYSWSSLKVADSGLLEGILLGIAED